MPARNAMQFEKLIDEATGKKDFQSLEQFLATEECENVSHKCSKQFVNKLDKLLCWALDKQEFKSISTLVNAVQKCGRKISIAGEDGLPAMIKHGLVGRMVNWFEKLKGILVLRGNEKNEMLTSLAEDFFIMLLTVCDSRPEGKMQVLENFVLRTCSLITDARINIYVQQEVIKKLNLLLDKIPRDAREKILSTKEMLLVMSEMGRTILDAGDYDTQVAITEALCRMVSEKQRAVLASQWFPMEFVSTAFKGIKDSEFETDCRKFLNQVNGMLGDKRRVFTFPCLSAALDKHELQIPLDENLEEFWIDFNVGSRSISFYVAAEDADHQWETVIIQEDDVSMYSLEEKDSKKLLTIDLKSPMSVNTLEGGKFLLYFDSILEIKDVIIKIYGFHKCKEFSKKQSASVVKTTVHIVFDESGSQVLVPESQLSLGLKEKSGDEEKLNKYKIQQPPGSLRSQSKNNSQEKLRGDSSKITPSRKRKVSEASVLIPGTSVSTRSPPFFVNTSTPFKRRFKLPLEMTSSTKRSDNDTINESRTKNSYQEPPGQMHSEEVLKVVQEATEKQTLDEVLDIIPDSQPVGRSNKPLLPGLLETSFDKTETWKKRTFPLPEKNVTTGDKQKPNLSLKPKSKEMADAAKSLISKISDRYRDKSDVKSKARDSLGFNRTHLNKSWISKEEVQDRTLKTASFLNITAGRVLDDVYNFNISGFDEPTIKLGIQELRVTELSVHTETNRKGNTAISKSSTEGKGGKKTRTNRDKKHLFSDSDTENKGDDSKTEISWLQESKRKPKAQIIDYSRSKKSRKPKSPDKTNKSSEPTYHMDKAKGKNTNKKKINKNPQDSNEMIVKSTRKKLPRRAAATKNYKEPSSSECESEEEIPTCTSREKSKIQKYMNGAVKDSKQPKAMQMVPVEPLRVDSCVQKTLVQARNSAEQKEVEMPSPESPASLETMRCAERVSDVSPEHSSSERSLGLQESTPEAREMLNSERATSPSNFCPQNESFQSLGVTQSPETAVTKLAFGRKSFSPVLTEASVLSLTKYKTVSGKNSKGAAAETCNNNEDSSFQHRFSDTFSAKGRLQDITKPIPKNKEEVSPSPLSSRSRVQSWIREPYSPLNESGPSVQTFHKRIYHSTTESSSDEAETSKEEEKKGRRRISLQPKKLFKTDDAVTCRVSETVSTQSVNDLSGLDGEFWKPDCSTISICQQLQKEVTKKIENRSRKMDNYNKQTLRAAHQHLATMSHQLHECRIKQLDEFHFTLTEELEKFEKDSQSLKIMEKEFLTFWKKHSQSFSTYMKNEQQRIQVLKTSFEKNICYSVGLEENVFTSEMHLMKEDIKGLQEKFLKEMQEEELCNVRRGLQTLFQSKAEF
ncbi:PREDICTED: synaptonemal complex protein 2 [Sturnus vulgaris]|uniref:synaptonemal complex protein 2 n=1 Tax=Sturnus vulgaris TaxID=9172 RepID=UPI00071AA76B|nr:PREDICTED: synaptonemal complex protein 2 [Sturnus vulgaris]